MAEFGYITCPRCGESIKQFRNPALTVDIIIEMTMPMNKTGIVLIKRKNPPIGWALPGGFVDYGESVENAARREAQEETSLRVNLKQLLGVYSTPERDPRGHTVSVVFIAEGRGQPKAKDDAREVQIFNQNVLPEELVFDHAAILKDYYQFEQRQL